VLATLVITNEAPQRTVLFGVEPESLATGMGLTATVAATLPRLVTALAREIADAGLGISPRPS
jgi:hydrogenase maturation protease